MTLGTWVAGSHTADGHTYPTYHKGVGPGVVVIHEAPGLTPAVIGFGEEVVEAGYTVVLPSLFGKPGVPPSATSFSACAIELCVRREFTLLATGRTSPLAPWLRSLARELHASVGGPGVGVVGMCYTGGFALATMLDPAVIAPVVAQPANPVPLGARRKADLGLSPDDLAKVKQRVADGCAVLGLRYASDPLVGTRFDTLTRELGDGFIRVDLDGEGHSTLTNERNQQAVDAVLALFAERLSADGGPGTEHEDR